MVVPQFPEPITAILKGWSGVNDWREFGALVGLKMLATCDNLDWADDIFLIGDLMCNGLNRNGTGL